MTALVAARHPKLRASYAIATNLGPPWGKAGQPRLIYLTTRVYVLPVEAGISRDIILDVSCSVESAIQPSQLPAALVQAPQGSWLVLF